jgi:hypothetical protein
MRTIVLFSCVWALAGLGLGPANAKSPKEHNEYHLHGIEEFMSEGCADPTFRPNSAREVRVMQCEEHSTSPHEKTAPSHKGKKQSAKHLPFPLELPSPGLLFGGS